MQYLADEKGCQVWFKDSWALSLGVGSVLHAEANAATPSIEIGLEHKGAWR